MHFSKALQLDAVHTINACKQRFWIGHKVLVERCNNLLHEHKLIASHRLDDESVVMAEEKEAS